MRAIHIDDVHMLARFAAQNEEAACFDVLTQAHIADKYRKNFCAPTQFWDGFDFLDLVSHVGTLGRVKMDQRT